MTLEICHAKCPAQTADLITFLKRTDLGKRETTALNEIKTQMVQEFSDNSKSHFYWQEACMLSEIATETEFEELVFAFSTAITDGVADGRPVNHALLKSFVRCLRQSKHKIPYQRARFGSVLAGLNSHLTATIQTNDLQTTYFLIGTIGTVLDAMVDIKFSDLDREMLHSPLKKTLEGLAGKGLKEPRISQTAEYVVQALSRVPDNEGPWEEFFRVSGDTIQAVAKISGGAAKLDPSQILDAGPDLLILLKFFASAAKGGKDIWDTRDDLKQMVKAMQDVSERKGWYDALRQTDILIRSKAYTGLKKVLPMLKCLNKAPFWCGLFSQLEQQWVYLKKGEREEVEETVQWILHEKNLRDHWTRHDSVRCWIDLLADSLPHPEWKDLLSQKRKHRLSLFTRRKDFDPQLKTMPQKSHEKEELSPYRLLHKALSSCKFARLFYADAILAQYYTNGSLLNIKRLSGDDVPMGRCYVNLSLVENQSEQNEKEHSIASLQQRLEAEAPKGKKDISLQDLFKRRMLPNKQLGNPTRILIRGRAGVGKTTLCKKITHDFLHNGLWTSDYDRVIWIPLRRLKDHPSLESFLESEVFRKAAHGSDMQKILEENLNNSDDNRSLFILDGLDEIIGYQRPGGSLIDCISDLFNRKHVIITSRPHAALPTTIDSYDLEVETVGFHDREIASYVENVISDPSQRTEIMNFMGKHWAMKGLMRIPIQLDALCFTWSEDLFTEQPITTMTGLYSKIEMKLHHKDMVRMGKTVNDQPLDDHSAALFKTHRQIYRVMKSPIDLVRFMAFFGMYHGLTEFTSHMRNNIHDAVGDTTDIDLDHISFLRGSDSSIAHQNREYYFLHLTFQEYFAAQHFVHYWKNGLKIPALDRKFARLLEIDPDDFLAREKYNGRYNIMWRFITGILEIEDNGEEDFLLKFLKQTGEQQPDLLGPSHLRFLMHSFSEISQPEHNIQMASLWKKTCVELLRLLLFDFRNGSYLIHDVEMEFPENVLVLLLKEGSSGYKENIVRILLQRRFLSPRICDAVVQAFNLSEDAELRSPLACLIGKYQQFPSQLVIDALRRSEPEIVRRLLIGLGDREGLSSLTVEEIFFSAAREDRHVCLQRASFIGEQRQLPERILQEMISGLSSDSALDRSTAIRSLRNSSLSQRDIFDRVVSELNEHIGTDTEVWLEFLKVQPLLSPRVIQIITEKLEKMNEIEIRRAVKILQANQPLESCIVNRVWSILDLEGADFNTRNKACSILWNQNALSEDECRARFLVCQRKDGFALAVTSCFFENGLCPPEPILNHLMSAWSKSRTEDGSKMPLSYDDPFTHRHLPTQALNSLWVIYDDHTPYISQVLGRQTSLPDGIVRDLVSRLRADAAKGLDTEDYLIALRGRAVPEDILEHAADALSLHEEDPPLHLLGFFFGQGKLPARILNAVLTAMFHKRYTWQWIEDFCARNGGLERFMLEAEASMWKIIFEALFVARHDRTTHCFIHQNYLHIKSQKVSVQVSIEADEQRQKLQSAVDHIHELTHSLVGSSEEEQKILSLIENLTLEPEG